MHSENRAATTQAHDVLALSNAKLRQQRERMNDMTTEYDSFTHTVYNVFPFFVCVVLVIHHATVKCILFASKRGFCLRKKINISAISRPNSTMQTVLEFGCSHFSGTCVRCELSITCTMYILFPF